MAAHQTEFELKREKRKGDLRCLDELFLRLLGFSGRRAGSLGDLEQQLQRIQETVQAAYKAGLSVSDMLDLLDTHEGTRELIFQAPEINRSYIGIIERKKTKIVKRGDGTKQVLDLPRSQWLVMEREDLRIVPQDLWDAVRERMKVYQRKKVDAGALGKPFRYEGTTNHVLTGICKCAECGGGFIIVTGKGGGYYGCQKAHRLGGCDNHKVISWKKLELPVIRWLVEQIQNDEICKVLAAKYNEIRRARVHGGARELDQVEERLQGVDTGVSNIVKSLEQCPDSPSLLKRLTELEREQHSLQERVKFLRGVDQTSLYITPTAIKQRFGEIPNLLLRSEPFQVNRALKPLLLGKGIQLEKRVEGDKTCYWATGTLNLGRAMALADQTGPLGNEGIAYEIPLVLKLD